MPIMADGANPIPMPVQADRVFDTMDEYGRLGVPFLFIVDFELRQPVIRRLDVPMDDTMLYDFGGDNANQPARGRQAARPVLQKKRPIDFDRYRRAFDHVVAQERAGNSYLVNLTFPTEIDLEGSLKDVYMHAKARYKLLYRDQFVVFSPEAFVRIVDGVISTYPMKGTIPAGIPSARSKIIRDPKEHAEHVTIVDLLRNDLSQVAANVAVKRFRYLENVTARGRPLLQVSSEIAGDLHTGYAGHIGSLLRLLLPAGSVSGAPKQQTLKIIRHAEGAPRGYYCGVMGTFDGRDLDSAVMIRYIEKTPSGTFYRSGGGITVNSAARNEYAEMIDKVYLPF